MQVLVHEMQKTSSEHTAYMSSKDKTQTRATSKYAALPDSLQTEEQKKSIASASAIVFHADTARGYIFLGNIGSGRKTFPIFNQHLNMVMPAKVAGGEWTDIQTYIYNYHRKHKVASGKRWEKLFNEYRGSMETQFRMKVYTKATCDPDLEECAFSDAIYSNVFGGSINPGQLWN